MSARYFAQIDENNIVTAVHFVEREFLESNPDRYTGTWVETFYNFAGKTYAGVGYIYDVDSNDFIEPPTPVEP